MLKRAVARWQAELVVFGLVLAYTAVALIVNGCGGGGGKPLASSRSAVEDIARTTNLIQKFTKEASRPRLAVLRSRQATCPLVTINWERPNLLVITVDYGRGCRDEEGDFFKGSVSIRIHDPELDEEGDLIGASRIVISYNNFSDGRQTISGSVTASSLEFNPEGDLVSFGYSGDIRYTNTKGCSLRLVEEGTITEIDETKFTETGSGEVSGSLNASYQMSDLLWDLASDCDYPEDGVLQITSGGRTETWTFSSVCGRAKVTVDDKSQVVTLPPLEKDDPDDPCD